MIYITDGQDGNILDVIPDRYIEEDWHERSLSNLEETYELITWSDMPFSEHLQDRNRLLVPDEDGTYREFIITIPRKYRDGQRLVLEVTALASYLEDLAKAKVIEPLKTESITNVEHVKNTLEGTIWQPGNIKYEGIRTLTIEKNTNPFAFLKRLANEFGLEINFRIEIEYNRVVGRYVDMVERIGEWRGRTIEFAKDLLGIERTEDTSNVVTSLIGYGPERDDGTRLKVVVEDKEALERWGMRDPKTGALKHLVAEYEPQSNDQDMTLDRLRTLVENELEKRIKALVSYKVTFADVEHVPGLENEKVRFGDTDGIKDTRFNPPLYLEARVHKLGRSTVDKSRKQAELGDFTEYTEEEVNAIWQSLQNEIRNRLSKLLVTTVVSSAGTTFKNGVGSTELSATVFLTGNETDKDGTLYDYKWSKRDKDGNLTSFEANGKTITVNADQIDEKATYIVDVMQDGHTLSLGVITISNVFDGTQGIQGPPGEDGKSSYTHIAYADNAQGGGFSQDPTDKKYMGVYVDHQPQNSDNPNDYKWSLIKGQDGEDGIPGKPGEDGRTPYLHIAYADDAQGNGFSQSPDDKDFIGTYTDFNPTDSSNPSDYKWQKARGPNKVDANTDFEIGYNPIEKETPDGAQEKADRAKEGAKKDVETGKVGLPGGSVTGEITGDHLDIDLAVFGANPQFRSAGLWNSGVWTVVNESSSVDPNRQYTFDYFVFRPTKKKITAKGAVRLDPLSLDPGNAYGWLYVEFHQSSTVVKSEKISMNLTTSQTKDFELTTEIDNITSLYIRFRFDQTGGSGTGLPGMRLTTIYLHD